MQQVFVAEKRVEQGDHALQHVHADAARVQEQRADQPRQDEQVQAVVAHIGHLQGGFRVGGDHVAERVGDADQEFVLQPVLDDHVRIVLRQPRGVAVGRLIEQVDVELQLLAQLLQVHGVLGRGQQRQADQVHRVGDGGGVDAGDHVAAQVVDGGFEPVRGFVH